MVRRRPHLAHPPVCSRNTLQPRTMLQVVFFIVLSLSVSANALSSCHPNNSTPVNGACPDPTTRELFGAGRMYENQIYEFLDVTLREKLQAINGTGRLPVLDPLAIPYINLTLGDGSPGYDPLNLQLDNVTIENLLGYVPYNGSYVPVGFKIPVGVDFPIITAKGYYEMDGWLGEGLLYLTGSGNFNFSLINVSLYVELDMQTVNNILNLECIGIHYNVGAAECNLENLLGGGDVGDMLNAILADAIPTLLNLARDRLIGRLICPLKDIANNALTAKALTMNDLLCLIGVQFACDNSA